MLPLHPPPFHRLANLFPLLEGEPFEELKADIQANGLIEPIWTYRGAVLDRRNRYRACQETGIDSIFQPYLGDNPVDFVVSKNLVRRHLDESQRSMVV
jgi:ParB-like chromosome segregation protein Spo0J